MAAIELEWLAGPFVLAREPGEGLDRGGRQRAQHVGDVRAAAHVPHRVVQALAKPLQKVRADERAILRSDRLAPAWIGHAVALRLDVADREFAIDRDAHPHVVHRLAGGPDPGEQGRVVVLDVHDAALDVEEPVVALKACVGDLTGVETLARGDGCGEGHRMRAGRALEGWQSRRRG